MPFTNAEPMYVCSCLIFSDRVDGRLAVWGRRIEDVGLVISSEMVGAIFRLVTDTASLSGWLLEESPLRKGMKDDRFRSFFGVSADGMGGGAAFFLLPITVPRRLFKPCFLGVFLISDI